MIGGWPDLLTYSQSLGATLSSWRETKTDAEVDAVLELPNGRWALACLSTPGAQVNG